MTHPPRRLPPEIADGAYGVQRWRNQPIEREPDVLRTRALWRALLAIVIAMAPAGIYLYQQNECLKLTYGVSSMREEQRELADQERRLTGRHASLESLQTIEEWATGQGLNRPPAVDVVVLQDPMPQAKSTGAAVALARVPATAGSVND
jgi:hypothetical protein